MNNQDTFLDALRRLPSGIIEDITKRADELTPYDPTGGLIAPTIKTFGNTAINYASQITNTTISLLQRLQDNKEKTNDSPIKIQMFYSGGRLYVKSNSNLDNQKIGEKTLREIFNSKNPNIQPAGQVSPVETTEFFKISSPLSTDKIYDVEIEPKQFNSVNNQTTYLLNFKFTPDVSRTDPNKPNLPPLGSTLDPKQYQIEFNTLSSLIIINDAGKITPIGIQKPLTNSTQGYDRYSNGLVSGSRVKENAYSDMYDKFAISTDNDNSKKYGEPTLNNQIESTQTTGLIQGNTQTGYLYLICDKHDRLNGNTEVTCKIIKFSVTKDQNPVQIATIVNSKVYDCIDEHCKISVLNNRILISDKNDVCLLSNSLSLIGNQNIIFNQQNNLCKSTTHSSTGSTQTSSTTTSAEKETTNDSISLTTDNAQSTTSEIPLSSNTTDLSTLTDELYTTMITETTKLSTVSTTTSNPFSTASTASNTTENSHTITSQDSNSTSTDQTIYTNSLPITSIDETTSYQKVNTTNIEYTSTNNEHMSTNFSTNSSTSASTQSTSTKNIPSASITTTLITKSNSPTTNTKTRSPKSTTRNTTLSTNSPSSNSTSQSTSYTPSSSTNNENNQSNGLSNGAIAGIAIGATITLGVLMYGTKKLYDWYNKEEKSTDIEMQDVNQNPNSPNNTINTEKGSWLSRVNPLKLWK